jgi:uncharacterized protein (DUF1697 family)
MNTYVALLRGINVGGKTSMPMAELRHVAASLGLEAAATYIQSGNLFFNAAAASGLEPKLEASIERRFGIQVPVMVRSSDQWSDFAAANPFMDAAEAQPNKLMMMVSKSSPDPAAAEALRARAAHGERIEIVGGAVWIHYPDGAGRTKLSPSLIDRLVGSPTTARNWRTVLKTKEILGQSSSRA